MLTKTVQCGRHKPFLFIHIRKTAGTSLHALLANQFPGDRVLLNAHSVSGPQEPADALFATGHVDFDYVRRFRTRPTIFTVLREPVSLASSCYHYFLGNDEEFFRRLESDWTRKEYQSRRLFTDRARQQDMLSFLTREEELARPWLSNVQTRQLAGASCVDGKADDAQLLETALKHLRQCDLVGLVERLDDTLLLVRGLMNWGRIGPLQHLNRTDRQTPDINARCIAMLRSWNTLDLRLHEEAVKLLQSKLKSLKRDPSENALDLSLLPDGANFTPDKTIRGYGWHQREFHDGNWLCWNSATTATLFLSLANTRPSRFRCFLSHAISPAALRALRISMNSVPLNLQEQRVENGWLFEGPLRRQVLQVTSQPIRITFECPVMEKPCDINPPSSDGRSLGVALGWIRID